MTQTSYPSIPAPRYTFASVETTVSTTYTVTSKHAAPAPCNTHVAVVQRDGLVPWCSTCGLDESGRAPIALGDALLMHRLSGRHAEREAHTAVMPVIVDPCTAPLPAHRRPGALLRTRFVDFPVRRTTDVTA